MRKFGFRSFVLASGLLLAAAPAGATVITGPTISVGVSGGATYNLEGLGTLTQIDAVKSSWALSGPWHSYDSGFEYAVNNWTALLDTDPFVTNNVNVTNNSLALQTFVTTVLLPISAFAYDTAINSSVGVTVTDSNGSTSMLFQNNGSTAIFVGTVNLGSVLPLNPTGPATLPITLADCSPSFTGCTTTSSTGIASQAVPAGTATLIGITLTFELSPGDSAGLTSRFEIVPEPGTLALALSGLVGLGLIGRRRS
jgi:hypothetical protein